MPFPNATPDDWNTKKICDITNMANKPVTWQTKEWTQVNVVLYLVPVQTMAYRGGEIKWKHHMQRPICWASKWKKPRCILYKQASGALFCFRKEMESKIQLSLFWSDDVILWSVNASRTPVRWSNQVVSRAGWLLSLLLSSFSVPAPVLGKDLVL